MASLSVRRDTRRGEFQCWCLRSHLYLCWHVLALPHLSRLLRKTNFESKLSFLCSRPFSIPFESVRVFLAPMLKDRFALWFRSLLHEDNCKMVERIGLERLAPRTNLPRAALASSEFASSGFRSSDFASLSYFGSLYDSSVFSAMAEINLVSGLHLKFGNLTSI